MRLKKNASASFVRPVLMKMVAKYLEVDEENDSVAIKAFNMAVATSIRRRFTAEVVPGGVDILTKAAFMDPRFKHLKVIVNSLLV